MWNNKPTKHNRPIAIALFFHGLSIYEFLYHPTVYNNTLAAYTVLIEMCSTYPKTIYPVMV